jgi:flagellar basal-body rod protein FlgF
MDPMIAMAASGLRSRLESLDLVANNLANLSTGGYKADREFYSLYASPEAIDSGQGVTMPVIERPWIDLAQGSMLPTGNTLDVALSGKGFFTVQSPGGPLYTRNGNFHLAADGTLTTEDGYPVSGAAGAVLRLQTTGKVDVSRDGTVTQDGQIVGQLQVVDFPGAAGLAKQGNNYFRSAGATPAAAADVATTVEQGRLEASNTSAAESAVRMISIMRQFEMMQKAATTALEMNQQAIEQVAKV